VVVEVLVEVEVLVAVLVAAVGAAVVVSALVVVWVVAAWELLAPWFEFWTLFDIGEAVEGDKSYAPCCRVSDEVEVLSRLLDASC